MGRYGLILSWIAALVLTLTLALNPALPPQGPGDPLPDTLAQGALADAQDASDTDHAPAVLPSGTAPLPPLAAPRHAAQAQPPAGIIRDGPHRPPRLS